MFKIKQTQLIKGVLEGSVLAIIATGDVYGYQLIQALHQNGFTSVMGGTLYPLLAKLETNGDLKSTLRPSPNGPSRKYYSLTAQGTQTLAVFTTQWQTLKAHVDKLLKEPSDYGS